MENLDENNLKRSEYLELIQNTMYDSSGRQIAEKWTTKWLDKNPEIKDIVEKILPDTYLKLQAIENIEGVYNAQEKYKERKILYIIFSIILGFAIYDKWGAVIGFICGYLIWYYFQPLKFADKLAKKGKKIIIRIINMLYIFSFKKLENPILLSKERNIYLKNIDNSFELNFFVNNFFRYQVSKIGIIPNYFSKNNGLNSIIKIDNGLNFEEYVKNRFSFDKNERESKKNDEKIIIENHNIFNVILFSLSLIMYNQDLIDNNIYLQNLDSNKYSKLENKINVNGINNILNPYLNFSTIEKDLIEIFWFFDFNYKKYNLENFIYIGELLNLYNSTASKYFRFTQLVSIIEFLLTKGEKDLTQQFKLKTGIVIERLIKLNQILDKKHFQLILFNSKTLSELNYIYSIRSSIVHGNLKEINSKINGYKKNYDTREIQDLINFDFYFRELQNITAGLLYLYIQEPEYIDFLKNN